MIDPLTFNLNPLGTDPGAFAYPTIPVPPPSPILQPLIPGAYGNSGIAQTTPQMGVKPISLYAPNSPAQVNLPLAPIVQRPVQPLQSPTVPPVQPLTSGQYTLDNGTVVDLGTGTVISKGPKGPASYIPPVQAGSYQSLLTPAEQAQQDAMNAILGKTDQVTDPEALYQSRLKAQQSEIDAQNNVYNDMLTNSRIQNAPEYLRRANSTASLAVTQGLTGSNVGQGMANSTADANAQQQASAEALINERRAQAIASIKHQIRQSSEAEAIANVAARRSGAQSILENMKSRQTLRTDTATKAIKGLLAAGVDVSKMTDSEKKSYLEGIGITQSEWDQIAGIETKDYAAQKAKATADAQKAVDEAANKQASTAKIIKETGQLGKMTQYQSALIAQKNATQSTNIPKAYQVKAGDTLTTIAQNLGYTPEAVIAANPSVNPTGMRPGQVINLPTQNKETLVSSVELNQQISPMLTSPAFKGMSDGEKKDYILSQGGKPSDFGF